MGNVAEYASAFRRDADLRTHGAKALKVNGTLQHLRVHARPEMSASKIVAWKLRDLEKYVVNIARR